MQTSLDFYAFDNAYVQRLRSGDFRTQEHFVAYFSELIRLKLRSRVRAPEDIEDLRQEVFARVLVALGKETGIREPDRLGSFVNSTCRNVLLEYYRGPKEAGLPENEQEDLADPSPDVVSRIADQQTQKVVGAILEKMPERERRILGAVFLSDRDKDEVCQEFGVDRDYLRVLVHRAKQQFKSLYLKQMSNRAKAAS
jgi:RNA polymerase sigma-70 factor, ECF subfamily